MERLCNLFQELLFPQAESIEDVTNEIVESLKNFSSIFLLVEIARTNQNPSIRNAALIFAYKFFCNNMDESDSITNDYVNELEKLKSNIEDQELTNQSLSMQIDELASLENIQKIAEEYGLSYINDNIKIVSSEGE